MDKTRNFVSFANAEALFHNGFREKTTAYYMISSHRFVDNYYSSNWNYDTTNRIYYAAPTLYDALDWLLEELYLHVEILYDKPTAGYTFRVVDIDNDEDTPLEDNVSYGFKVDCINAAIKKALDKYGLKGDTLSTSSNPIVIASQNRNTQFYTGPSVEDGLPIKKLANKVEILS